MRLSEEEINDIRSHADIVDIIGRYIPISKKGHSYVALCPFHDDHSPSLSISPDKQIYKCFVCGKGGNVFTFVQDYENCSFIEAVSKVAQMIGYKLSVDPSSFEAPKDPHREALYKVLNETIKYTMYQLNSSSATLIKEYLHQRGINDKVIEMFQIGYNGKGDDLYRFLSAKGYKDQDMTATNIVRISDSGLHDVFTDRITFPIHDSLGNPIGFSARTTDPENQSKYINTSETELYVKGNTVYNYHRAKPVARKEAKLIVCEGVTDVIAFARVGIFNVVATLGTACTAAQIQLLKQCCQNIVFCYDGDKAGQTATYKAAKLAKNAGCQVTIIQNKTSMDPDEIIKNFGEDELRSMATRQITWMEFVFSFLSQHYDLSNYSDKKEFAQKVMAEINELNDDFDRQNFIHQLSQITGFKINAMTAESKPQARKKHDEPLVRRVNAPIDGRVQAEILILSQMIQSQEACEVFKEQLGFLTDNVRQTLAMMIIDEYRKHGEVSIANLVDNTQDAKTKELLVDLTTLEYLPDKYQPEVFLGAINRVKIMMLEEKISDTKAQIASVSNEKSKQTLAMELMNYQREYRRYLNEEENKNN